MLRPTNAPGLRTLSIHTSTLRVHHHLSEPQREDLKSSGGRRDSLRELEDGAPPALKPLTEAGPGAHLCRRWQPRRATRDVHSHKFTKPFDLAFSVRLGP